MFKIFVGPLEVYEPLVRFRLPQLIPLLACSRVHADIFAYAGEVGGIGDDYGVFVSRKQGSDLKRPA